MSTQRNQNAAHDAPVVLLHASASSPSQWSALRTELERRHEVHAMALPGYGGASIRSDVDFKGTAMIAQPIIEQIARLGEPVHLVGHSFGGAVALKVALERPDLVASLTLYEPAVFHLLNPETGADAKTRKSISRIGRGPRDRNENATSRPRYAHVH